MWKTNLTEEDVIHQCFVTKQNHLKGQCSGADIFLVAFSACEN